MSAPRLSRLQKASALVPLALLSAAWTASIAGAGVSSASADGDPNSTLPDGSSVPSEAIEAPASVSAPGSMSAGVGDELEVRNVSTQGIPAAALAAYQRAETVINSADTTCNVTWQLIAAIGRVESDHGRVNGNSLNADGVATPGIFGIPLNGRNNTSSISDTDAGLYDADTKYDRAIGPMQFIPSTWLVVGVDADGDAERNPQDIDDAALASAVYLCSGKDDLSTLAGQRAAVYRYNHSQSYVDLVLSIMEQYLQGDFTSVPNGTTSAGFFVPNPSPSGQSNNNSGNNGGGNGGGGGNNGGGGNGGGGGNSGGGAGDIPVGGGDGDGDGGGLNLPGLPGGGGGDGGGGGGNPVEDVLTYAEATAQCVLDGVIDLPLTGVNELHQCAMNLLHP